MRITSRTSSAFRAFASQLLCEQVVGRGLRRMDYKPDPATGLLTEEYVDVYGIPFSVIPFHGRPVNKPAPDDTPKNLVRALPEREAMEIRFPVVEGYVFALRRNLIRCDVEAMERAAYRTESRTDCHVRASPGGRPGGRGIAETQSPFGFQQQDREAYYASVHLQTIQFQAAQRIVEELTQATTASQASVARSVFALQSRHALFPQVFRVVEEYVRRKVDFNGAPGPNLVSNKICIRRSNAFAMQLSRMMPPASRRCCRSSIARSRSAARPVWSSARSAQCLRR